MPDTMGVNDIAFPHLGIYLEDLPKSFSVFGFEIAFYGVIIGIGVILGVLMAERMARVEGMDTDIIWDFGIYAVIFSVIGARIYYVIFSWEQYRGDLLSVFNLRRGGLAIYGAVIAAFATLFVYSRIKKLSPYQIGDCGVYGLILGQILGRWGNFFNREVFGGYTDSLFAMRLKTSQVSLSNVTEQMWDHAVEKNGVSYIQVHPTFLYESVWNLVILFLMIWRSKHKKFDGEIFLMYLVGYGIGRAWIEGLRTDQLQIGDTGIAVSQVLSAVLALGGIVYWIYRLRKVKKEKPDEPAIDNQ